MHLDTMRFASRTFSYKDAPNNGLLLMHVKVRTLSAVASTNSTEAYHTLAWNQGIQRVIQVNGVEYGFAPNTMLVLIANQSFVIEPAEEVICWQFDGAFYHRLDSDMQLTSIGYLFYGQQGALSLPLGHNLTRFNSLLAVFADEFVTPDTMQDAMLLNLTRRLLVQLTRLARQYFLTGETVDTDVGQLRHYNRLVETYFREIHTVEPYAVRLHESPQALTDRFCRNGYQSPLLILQHRQVLEAHRLLLYTDDSPQTISLLLGFPDQTTFEQFFVRLTGRLPSVFRAELHRGGTA